MIFSPFLFSLNFTVSHIHSLAYAIHSFVPLSFWYTHLAKPKPWLNPPCASALHVVLQLNRAGENMRPWGKVITVNFKWALLLPNNHTVMSLVHSLSLLLDDDFITSYETPVHSLPFSRSGNRLAFYFRRQFPQNSTITSNQPASALTYFVLFCLFVCLF